MSSTFNPLTELDQKDWSFSSLNNTGLHSLHWYPATYIGAIPGTLLPILSFPNETVLDPFCGSGTTGIEALRLQRKFIGIDNNPIATLISQTKLYMPESRALEKKLKSIYEAATLFPSQYFADNEHPWELELLQWYHPDTYEELKSILGAILSIKDRKIIICLIGIFSSILKNSCSQGKHWGWVCDNVKPKKEEITYKNARSLFFEAAQKYVQSSKWAFSEARDSNPSITRHALRKDTSIFTGDCIRHMNSMPPNSVDLIMTSPPYYGVADYVKSQRLSYLWLDIEELDFIGARFKNFEDLRETEAGARSKRHRKTSFHDYIDFINSFLIASSRVLKKDRYAALIIGESKARKNTMHDIIDLAHKNNLSLIYKGERNIKNTRRRLMAKVPKEEIIIFENKK